MEEDAEGGQFGLVTGGDRDRRFQFLVGGRQRGDAVPVATDRGPGARDVTVQRGAGGFDVGGDAVLVAEHAHHDGENGLGLLRGLGEGERQLDFGEAEAGLGDDDGRIAGEKLPHDLVSFFRLSEQLILPVRELALCDSTKGNVI